MLSSLPVLSWRAGAWCGACVLRMNFIILERWGASQGYNGSRGRPMPAAHGSLVQRITVDPNVRFGKPCIRGHRITVQEVLEWLSNGASQQQILADYPQLEPDDFLAVYAYAAELAAGRKVSGG
ncbi:MAG: DUF433 domain-containing protein [Bryobacteraceae bacterium]